MVRKRHGNYIQTVVVGGDAHKARLQHMRLHRLVTGPAEAHDDTLLVDQRQLLIRGRKGHRSHIVRPDERLGDHQKCNVVLSTVHVVVGMHNRSVRAYPCELAEVVAAVAHVPGHKVADVLCHGQNVRGRYYGPAAEESSSLGILVRNVNMVRIVHGVLAIYDVVFHVDGLGRGGGGFGKRGRSPFWSHFQRDLMSLKVYLDKGRKAYADAQQHKYTLHCEHAD